MSRSLRILIVDDEAPITLAASRMLEDRGHDVQVASSAEEALELGPVDVLVTDLRLSGLSGIELVEHLQRMGEHPRTIFMTGLPTVEDCRRAMQLGAEEFLTKPFGLDDLIKAVEGAHPKGPLPAPAEEQSSPFHKTYTADRHAVHAAPRDLTTFAYRSGISPTGRARIGSAVAEIVENAMLHAYARPNGMVAVSATLNERELAVTVRDWGFGFDPLDASLNIPTEGSTSGLARASALSENLRIRSTEGEGTHVHLSFAAYRVHFDEEDCVDLSELDYFTPETSRQVLHALEDEDGSGLFQLSPALAATIGRLLAGPDPRRILQDALWS